VTEISFPAPRDLPAGHLAARKQHLLSEIAREQGRPRAWVPTILWPRRMRSSRPVLAAALVLLALVIAAVAVAAPSLFGFSNHGTRAHANSAVKGYLEGQPFKRLGLATAVAAKPSTFRRLAFRQGIGVYSARKKTDHSLCFYMGLRPRTLNWKGHPNELQLIRAGCSRDGGQFALPAGSNFGYGRKAGARAQAWLRAHPFPSQARPIMDLSLVSGVRVKQLGCSWCSRVVLYDFGLLAGVAANGVRSVQVLSLNTCRPVVTVPVINNVYIDAHPPRVPSAFLVARNAGGKIIWHGWQLENRYTHVPLKRKAGPPHCGFRKWESAR
jgi:hypothetical protein